MDSVAVGAVTVMASGALGLGIKLLMDVLTASTRRATEEIERVEHRHETERAEWYARLEAERLECHEEQARLRERIERLELQLAGGHL